MAPCPICESPGIAPALLRPRDYEYGKEASFGFSACKECGLQLATPLPEPREIETFYPSEYTSFGENQGKLNAWITSTYAKSEASRFRREFGGQTRVLDVGCGAGDFLGALGGGNALGIESNPEAVAVARARGLKVKAGEFEKSDWPAEAFDVIRMNHSLEHFHSPQRALSKAWEALAPGGILVGETPNTDCLDFKLLGRFWGGWHFPRHLWIFSRKSLTQLARKQGFRVKSIRNCYRTVGWSAGIQNWLVNALRLQPPRGGRFRWYPILIAAFLPVTLIQKLVSQTAIVEFVLEKELSFAE